MKLVLKLSDYILYETNKIYDTIREVVKIELPKIKLTRGFAFGAGDSYASALVLQYLSTFRFSAIDPIYIIKNHMKLHSSDGGYGYIAFSYKGKTKSVVKAARELREYGFKVIAVTSEPNSPLAHNADIVINIVKTHESLPVGISSFIAMSTAAARIAGQAIDLSKVRDVINESRKKEIIMKNLCEILKNVSEVVIVSNDVGLASGYYTCLKFYETLCMPCRVYPYEELLHAVIFSVRRDSLIMFYVENIEEVRSLSELLTSEGIPYIYVVSNGDKFSKFLTYIITGLRVILKFVNTLNVNEPCFMKRRRLLEATTPTIYY